VIFVLKIRVAVFFATEVQMRSLIACVLLGLSLGACRGVTDPLARCPEGMTQVIPNVCDDEINTAYISVRGMNAHNADNILWLKREWQKKYPKKEIITFSFGNQVTELLIQYEQPVAR